MREKFEDKRFHRGSLLVIRQADEIIRDYQARGFTLTLRQLYYQFVARGLLPNKQTEYKRLGKIVNDARLSGHLDWSAIEDRTRNLRRVPMWSSPESILKVVLDQYRENPWDRQPYQPEVWIEKDALIGVIENVCEDYRVPYFACRGYSSQSEQYAAGKRLQAHRARGKRPIILHLGDHDPSGIDMTRDNADRLTMFARRGIEVRRLALNMDQVEQYNPPPNPAKETDARFNGYQELHGDESWELDALDPTVIHDLIEQEIKGLIDHDAWADCLEAEEANRDDLSAVVQNWESVSEYVKGLDQ